MFCLTLLDAAVDVFVGDVGEVRRVDDHVDVGHRLEVAQLAQLQRGEGGLQGAAAADDHDLLDAAGVQQVEGVRRRCRWPTAGRGR